MSEQEQSNKARASYENGFDYARMERYISALGDADLRDRLNEEMLEDTEAFQAGVAALEERYTHNYDVTTIPAFIQEALNAIFADYETFVTFNADISLVVSIMIEGKQYIVLWLNEDLPFLLNPKHEFLSAKDNYRHELEYFTRTILDHVERLIRNIRGLK